MPHGPLALPSPVLVNEFGIPQFKITIEVDQKGLLRVRMSKPLQAVDVIGLFLDAMQGQYAVMRQQARMIIDPNKPETQPDANSGGKTEKGNDGNGGLTG